MKGVSPVVSYVLILAIVLSATMAAYMWAFPMSRELGELGRVNALKNQMIGLDYVIRATAHGDVNFTNEYEMHLQDATIRLDEDKDVIYLSFTQNTGVLGRASQNGSTTCNSTSNFLYDPLTLVPMFKESNYSRLFQGAAGNTAGPAEFALCYYDVDLQWEGHCIRGKTGTGTTILVKVKKTGFNTKPVVSIDVC